MKKTIRFCVIICLATQISSVCFAGAWTLPKGRIWLKAAVFYFSTNERFCTELNSRSLAFQSVGCTSAGQTAPFDPFIGGKSTALSVFTETTYGLTNKFDIGILVPFYSLRFTNLANPNRTGTNSIGDIRFFGKYRFLNDPVVASIMISIKSPTGKFTVDAEAVNVSEDQWDIDFLVEASKSFSKLPGFATIGLGYRVRTDNNDFQTTIGNEVIGIADLGIDLTSSITLRGSLNWLYGEETRIKLTDKPSLQRRELLTFASGINFKLKRDLNLESFVRFPLRGKDFPRGIQLEGAISYSFSLFNYK